MRKPSNAFQVPDGGRGEISEEPVHAQFGEPVQLDLRVAAVRPRQEHPLVPQREHVHLQPVSLYLVHQVGYSPNLHVIVHFDYHVLAHPEPLKIHRRQPHVGFAYGSFPQPNEGKVGFLSQAQQAVGAEGLEVDSVVVAVGKAVFFQRLEQNVLDRGPVSPCFQNWVVKVGVFHFRVNSHLSAGVLSDLQVLIES